MGTPVSVHNFYNQYDSVITTATFMIFLSNQEFPRLLPTSVVNFVLKLA